LGEIDITGPKNNLTIAPDFACGARSRNGRISWKRFGENARVSASSAQMVAPKQYEKTDFSAVEILNSVALDLYYRVSVLFS
jgi:hypothetical protein